MKQVAIGIDIGGTFTKYGIVDKQGHCLIDGSIPTSQEKDLNLFLNLLKETIDKAVSKISEQVEIVGIGIGAPDANYYKGTIEHPTNLAWEGIVPFVDEFKKYYNLPMFLTNDANAAAIGEMVYGGAKSMKNFIIITLGTGLGSGLVVNGDLVYGHDGFAGELGLITVVDGGRMCESGLRGSLETYVSAPGIKRTVFELLADSLEETEFRDVTFNQLTAKMISEAASKGDEIALMAFERTGEILGKALANTVMHNSPEAIFLFGGLANAGALITEPTKRTMEENLPQIFKNKVQILHSQLTETNAAVLGASALVWKELNK